MFNQLASPVKTFQGLQFAQLHPPRCPRQAGHERGEHQQSEEQHADGETSFQGIGGLNASKVQSATALKPNYAQMMNM